MDNFNNKKSKLDSLEKKLYERDFTIKRRDRTDLDKKKYDLDSGWKGEEEEKLNWSELSKDESIINEEKKGLGFFGYTMIVAALFFTASVGYASYVLFWSGNGVTAEDVDIKISGPASVGAGEVLSVDLIIQNNNPIPLESIDIIVEYPEGTKSAEDSVSDLKRERRSIEPIQPGQITRETLSSVLFGEEGDNKEVSVIVEYKVPNSNAVFRKPKVFNVILNAAPARIAISGLKEVSSGQEMELVASIISNSNNELKNLIVTADYPFGFQFLEADVEPSFSNNVWIIESISPKEKKEIKIKGIITGQNEEDRIFRFETGLVKEDSSEEIGVIFSNYIHELQIKRPFIGLNILLNSSPNPVVAVNSGSDVNAQIVFSNNTNDIVRNLDIRLNIEGAILDESTVFSEGGFYRSADNTLILNPSTDSDLKEIFSGRNYVVDFGFKLKELINSGLDIRNPEIKITGYLEADRVNENDVEEKIEEKTTRNLKVISDVFLGTYTLREMGPFENTGPIPPKAEEKTTYTLLWSVSNNSNDVEDAIMTAYLPAYVEWEGKVSPSSEVYSYDEDSRRIIWNIGNMPAGTGKEKDNKELNFQVSIIPSLTQVDTSPVLLDSITFTGEDTFTNTEIKINASNRPTTYLNEGTTINRHQIVVE